MIIFLTLPYLKPNNCGGPIGVKELVSENIRSAYLNILLPNKTRFFLFFFFLMKLNELVRKELVINRIADIST